MKLCKNNISDLLNITDDFPVVEDSIKDAFDIVSRRGHHTSVIYDLLTDIISLDYDYIEQMILIMYVVLLQYMYVPEYKDGAHYWIMYLLMQNIHLYYLGIEHNKDEFYIDCLEDVDLDELYSRARHYVLESIETDNDTFNKSIKYPEIPINLPEELKIENLVHSRYGLVLDKYKPEGASEIRV